MAVETDSGRETGTMTSIFDGMKWLFDGLKVHDMVAGFFHVAGIWVLIKVFSLEKRQ